MKAFRILVVDDNEDHRFFIKRALTGAADVELRLIDVDDGAEALRFLRAEGQWADREMPHMVLLDLRMPRKNGLEVLAEMREDADLMSVPVCVLTSSSRTEDVEEAYRLGTNSYVVKSGDVDDLKDKIASVWKYWAHTSSVPEPLA